MSSSWMTAADMGLSSCHVCGLVSRMGDLTDRAHCPRCGAGLHFRKTNSIARCWAMLIASYILYVPANLLPIMETGSIWGYRRDTIISGVGYLWIDGSRAVAVIVFIASVLVPLFKMIALTVLLISVQRRSVWRPHQRARLYRLVDLVGRWSMMDIYVVTILAAVVQMRSFSTVEAGPGAIPFGAVVVLTMFAAIHFDPRLIWDPLKNEVDT